MSIIPFSWSSARVRSDPKPTPAHTQVPRRSTALVPQEYCLRNGIPSVPAVWVQADTYLSAEGVHYAGRDSILDIFDDAYVRFIATGDSWDGVGFSWNPTASEAISRYQMDGDPLTSPYLSEFSYINGKELITADCLTFEDGDLLTSNFNDGADDAVSLTLAMAVSLKQRTTANLITFLDGSYLRVTPAGFIAKIDGRTFGVAMSAGPLFSEVVYLVLDLTATNATLLAAYGPAKIYKGSSPITQRTTSFTFTLTGHMDLFSLDIWAGMRPDLTSIIGQYSSVLGIA